MSSGAYDAPLPSSSYNTSWRPAGAMPMSYDRPHHVTLRRRSPSPSRHHATYDSYVPSRPMPVYRDEFPNVYRPASNSYRPEQPSTYYSQSPSPDRYMPLRMPESDAWDRSGPWQSMKAPAWPERKLAPPSPTTPVSRDRGRRDTMLATRMFEPSDAWKQTHVDRSIRTDIPRTPSIGYSDFRRRDSVSPDRRDRSPVYPTGDSYRPTQAFREPYVNSRHDYDSYRPSWMSSSPVEGNLPRSSNRYDYNSRRASASGSISGSMSPRSRHRSPPYRSGRLQGRRSPSHSPNRIIRSSSRERRSVSRGRRSTSIGMRRRSFSRIDRSVSRRRPISRGHYLPSRRSSSRGRRSRSRGPRSSSLAHRSRDRSPRSASRGPSLRRSISRGSSPRPLMSRQQSSSRNGAGLQPFKEKPIESHTAMSRSRPPSRSSIASTQVSRAPTPPPELVNPLKSEPLTASQTMESKLTSEDFIMKDSDPPLYLHKAEVLALSDLPQIDAATSGTSLPAPDHVSQNFQEQCEEKYEQDGTVATNIVSISTLLQSTESLFGTQPPKASLANGDGKISPLIIFQHDAQAPRQDVHAVTDTPTPSKIMVDADRENNPLSPITPVCGHQPTSEHGPAVQEMETSLEQSSPLNSITLSEAIVTEGPLPLPPIQDHDPAKNLPQSLPEIQLPEHIPNMSEAKSTAEALRIVVMTRLLCDRQPREERVNPVLNANLTMAAQTHDAESSTTADEIIKEATRGKRLEARMNQFSLMKGSLVERFKQRQDFLSEKTQRLREQYVSLHERWVAHCALLDEQAKPVVSTESEQVQPPGRTTRRSTANLGDAVRSDLEMEQIIASLGNDEATDPNQLSARNLAVIPDMISVTHGKVDHVFDDTNHLVLNPREYYGSQTGIHDWTEKEKEIFLDKFAAHPKQFGLIAEHIPNKTAAQCVDYYYLHKKKFIDFRKVISLYAPNKRRRRGMGKKKGNGLLADIRQHDAEVHRDSETPSGSGRTTRGRRNMPPPEPKKTAASRRMTAQLERTPTATPTPEPDSRPRRRRAIMATPVPLSRTTSTSLEEVEEEAVDAERPAKRPKRTRKVKSAAIVVEEPSSPGAENRTTDQNESASRRKPQFIIQWSDEDKNLFLTLIAQHGADFKRIAASMPNKTTIQVQNFYKNNLIELDLEKVASGAPRRSPTPEVQEAWKDMPYSGSGMTSPARDLPDPAPPMSSLAQETTVTPISPIQTREVHWPKTHPTWATPSTSHLNSVTSNPMKHPEVASTSSRPLSPNQVRSYTGLGYPATTRMTNVTYSSNALPTPSYPQLQQIPYTYPQYTDSHFSHYGAPQRHITPHSLPDPHITSGRRISSVPIHRGENPYPVLPGTGAPPPPYHYSLESS